MSRAALSLLLALAACGRSAPSGPPGPDVMVLDLGGNHAPLGPSLRAVDPTLRSAPTAPATSSAPASGSGSGSGSAPAPEPEPTPAAPEGEPKAEPAPAPAERWVELGAGQTISELARAHLGSAKRWREVLQVNGWTEEQARKLRPGTRVKLPP
jgi:hypothetical protein